MLNPESPDKTAQSKFLSDRIFWLRLDMMGWDGIDIAENE